MTLGAHHLDTSMMRWVCSPYKHKSWLGVFNFLKRLFIVPPFVWLPGAEGFCPDLAPESLCPGAAPQESPLQLSAPQHQPDVCCTHGEAIHASDGLKFNLRTEKLIKEVGHLNHTAWTQNRSLSHQLSRTTNGEGASVRSAAPLAACWFLRVEVSKSLSCGWGGRGSSGPGGLPGWELVGS